MTTHPADRIGFSADAAANAARLRAAAQAATLRVGFAPTTLSSERNEHQGQPLRASRARVTVELELDRENQGRAATARERHGPSPLFLAQYFAQETANTEGDAVVPAQAAAGYPSLGFDQDILLPGDATAFVTDGPRVDILV